VWGRVWGYPKPEDFRRRTFEQLSGSTTILKFVSGLLLSFSVTLLAAGRSRRMGRPKLLLPWGKETVIAHLLRQWELLGAKQIGVVTTLDAGALENELMRLKFPGSNCIINPDPDRGMFSSIQCAAAWTGWRPELTHFLISLGDQPHLKHETLCRLLDFAVVNPGKICQPLQDGRPRHPVILPRGEFAALAVSNARDLKEFLMQHRSLLAGFESNDPGLSSDMDSPADYELAKELYFGRS
jgi:molybdenum cofactor cytidylyltransferase